MKISTMRAAVFVRRELQFHGLLVRSYVLSLRPAAYVRGGPASRSEAWHVRAAQAHPVRWQASWQRRYRAWAARWSSQMATCPQRTKCAFLRNHWLLSSLCAHAPRFPRRAQRGACMRLVYVRYEFWRVRLTGTLTLLRVLPKGQWRQCGGAALCQTSAHRLRVCTHRLLVCMAV